MTDLIQRIEAAKEPRRENADRIALADRDRPCLYRVAGPCFHPRCLMAHSDTIMAILRAERKDDE